MNPAASNINKMYLTVKVDSLEMRGRAWSSFEHQMSVISTTVVATSKSLRYIYLFESIDDLQISCLGHSMKQEVAVA